MNKSRVCVVISLCVLGVAAAAQGIQYGYDVLNQWGRLPQLKIGAKAGMASSWSRIYHEQPDFDDYNWYDGYGYQLHGDYNDVLVRNIQGPGVITRMWMPWNPPNGVQYELKMYFDGESTPRIDTTTQHWFEWGDPSHPVAADPYVKRGMYGAWSYVPLTFQNKLRIETSNVAGKYHFYQFEYLQLPSDTLVQSYQPGVVPDGWTAGAAKLNNIGSNPGPNGAHLLSSSGTIADGQSMVLANLTGQSGVIRRLQIKFDNPSDAQLLGTHLRVYYDNRRCAGIDVPVGEFFGAGQGRPAYKALALGTDHSDGYYCYLPMPFRSGVRVELVNESGESVSVVNADVEYDNMLLEDDIAYLRGSYNHIVVPQGTGAYVPVLDVRGRGHYLGCMLTIDSDWDGHLTYLEGDEIIAVDGADPRSWDPIQVIYGTGLEDAFNGGYYYSPGSQPAFYDGAFAGVLYKDKANARTCQYRHRIMDYIPFEKSILVQFESFDGTQGTRDYQITSYWYQYYMPGDVDGNGVVDGSDLTAVISAWMTHPGQEDWNPDADLDCNGVIDGFDLAEVVSNWTDAALLEPAGVSLLVFGAMLMLRRRKR